MKIKTDYDTDLIGRRFGFLEALYKDSVKTKQGKSKWVCKCHACGKIISIPRARLISEDAKSCGCMLHAVKGENKLDLTDRVFGDLKVLEKVSGNGVSTLWRCRCNGCGKITDVLQSNLISGATTSCGCVHRKQSSENIKKYIGIVDLTNVSIISSKKVRVNNTSGVKGVYYAKNINKWHARIMFQGKSYNLGYYKKKEDAIKAREEAEKNIYGPFLEWYKKLKDDA